MEFKDYYKILGVDKNATEQQVKAAYRKLARKYHPDLNPGDKKAEERFKEINEAYDVLSSPEKRKKYDELGSNWEQILRDREYARQYAQPGFEGWVGEGFDLGDFFETFFGRRGESASGGWSPFTTRPPSGPQRGADLEQEVAVSLEESFHGIERRLTLLYEEICPDCGGSGMRVVSSQQKDRHRIITQTTVCPTCRGTGAVRQHRTLQVKIPMGVVEGARVRLAGVGGKGSNGGPPGDLYLRIRLQPHKTFVAKGNDLYGDLPIMDYEAALGAEVQVPTLGGSVWMTIPPETQTGTQLRLKGKGLPHFQSKERGDLYFTVKIVIPTKLSDKEKELIKQFRESRQKRGETDPRRGLV